jgi:predicted esterase YcpF (UPF0227 family)
MKVAFFHGLESAPRSFKNECLEEIFEAENVYAPAMDYHNPEMFDTVLYHLKHNPVDLLIGSSMGGWFALNLSTLIDTPTLLFNPATNNRSFNPRILSGGDRPKQFIVLGKDDNVVDPIENAFILKEKYGKTAKIVIETMGHRIPDDVFEKYMLMFKN